jgi:ribosomal protein S8
LILVIKFIKKMQKEKYLMMFMMEKKLDSLEKKSFNMLKNGLNESMQKISVISSKLKLDFFRTMWKRGIQNVAFLNKLTKKSETSPTNTAEFRLSARDLAFTNQCFKLDEVEFESPKFPNDSFA